MRPHTALDDLIAEQTMEPRHDPERDDVSLVHRPRRRCPECGCPNGGHTSVHCPGWED